MVIRCLRFEGISYSKKSCKYSDEYKRWFKLGIERMRISWKQANMKLGTFTIIYIVSQFQLKGKTRKSNNFFLRASTLGSMWTPRTTRRHLEPSLRYRGRLKDYSCVWSFSEKIKSYPNLLKIRINITNFNCSNIQLTYYLCSSSSYLVIRIRTDFGKRCLFRHETVLIRWGTRP
jgi:hypothetical protein